MYIPRTNDDSACPSGVVECTPKFAITGTDPADKTGNTTHGPVDYGKPGPRRYIGIGMVAGMLFVGLAAYVIFGKAPRRWMRAHGRWGRRRRAGGEGKGEQGVKVMLDPSDPSSSSEELKTGAAGSMEWIPAAGMGKLQPNRRRPEDEKGAESGMMPSPKNEDMGVNGRRSGHLPGWEVEHLRGVCYQVLSPKDDVRIVDHIQTPSPTYHR